MDTEAVNEEIDEEQDVEEEREEIQSLIDRCNFNAGK